MKINLRFILAYMDDILNPADTAEVAKLLKEDPAAEELVHRIGEVVRKRRLSAPQLLDESEGKDANDVAEYLDNLMSPEQIRKFEQNCLDSDERLAEVAGSHEILTLVLGGKGDVPSSTRQRLEEIANSVSEHVPENGKPFGSDPIPLSAVDIPVSELPENEMAAESQVPATFEIPKRNSNWKNKGGIVAIGLLFAAWIYSIATDDSFQFGNAQNTPQLVNKQVAVNEQNQQASTEINKQELKPSATVETKQNTSTEAGDSKTPQNPAKQNRLVASTETENSTKSSIDPAPPALPKISLDEPKGFQPPLVKPSEEKPAEQVAMINKNAKPEENPPKVENVKPVVAQPKEPICFTPSIVYTSENQQLIRQAVGQTNSVIIMEMTEIEPGDRLFTLRNTEAEFSVDSGKGNLRIFENSAVEILGANEHSCFGFSVKQGRLIFSFQPDAADNASKKIRLVIQEIPWYFELPKEPGSIVIEVTPQKSTHYEQLPPQGLVVASAWVMGPAVRLMAPDGKWEEIKQAKQLLPLASAGQANQAQKVTESSLPLPEWASQSAVILSSPRGRDQKEFIKKIAGSVNLWLDLEGVASDPNPHIAELAAQALALGGRYESLVNILVHSSHEESRTAAITGLRTWLPQSPKNREILRTLLDQTVNESTAFVVYNLLWGYDKKDARDSELSRQLVAWLRHDHAAVRELSIYWISQLTGKKLGYRPLASLKTREQGATSWERHLAKVGALLPPEE